MATEERWLLAQGMLADVERDGYKAIVRPAAVGGTERVVYSESEFQYLAKLYGWTKLGAGE